MSRPAYLESAAPLSRRRLLAGASLFGLGLLSGCAVAPTPTPPATAPAPTVAADTPTPGRQPTGTATAAPSPSPVPGTPPPPTATTASPATPAVARIPVVVTFSLLDDLVGAVGGERLDRTVIVRAGQDTHTFEPVPAHAIALTRARLVFEIGLGFEGWLDRLYQSSGARARRVVVAQGIPTLRPSHAGEEGDGHDHGEEDPHVWHDVRHAMHMVRLIRDALIDADAPGRATYESRSRAYLEELERLDRWIVDRVATIPEPRRTLITSHESFGYFASRYGFALVGSVLGSISTEAAEPSAGALARIVGRIRAERVPAIFAENVSNPAIVERVAREAGVRLGRPLFTDALGPAGSPGDSYVALMRYNVDAIVDALGS